MGAKALPILAHGRQHPSQLAGAGELMFTGPSGYTESTLGPEGRPCIPGSQCPSGVSLSTPDGTAPLIPLVSF